MMKLTTANISQCEQKWEEMTPVEGKGMYCSQCKKCLMDFRGMTDEEILAIHNGSKERICGVYSLPAPDKKLYSPFATRYRWLAIAAATLGLTIALPSQAAAHWQKPPNQQTSSFEKEKPQMDGDTLLVIRGYVRDSTTKEPIEYSYINLQNTEIGVLTDMNGYFELRVPENLITQKIEIEVSFIGYESKFIEINPETMGNLFEIQLVMGKLVENIHFVGYIIPSEVMKNRKRINFFKKAIKKFF